MLAIVVISGARVVGTALKVLGFAEGFWVDWCVDIGADADDAETVGDWSGSGLVGRYPAHSEFKVECGVMVLGMWHESLDSEYTVTSSSRYSNSSEVKDQNVGSVEVSWNWLQLVRCVYLQSCPGYFEWRLQIEFPECARMEEVCQNDFEYEYEGEGNKGSEFRGMQNVQNALE